MVAPNGARRTKADHPAIPMTIAETVATARGCHEAGADGLHAHVRDETGAHVLDAGLYRELLAEMAAAVPGMMVQITTEAVGRFTPAQQRQVVADAEPKAVSIALREITAEPDEDRTRSFFHGLHERETAVQHILYASEEITALAEQVGKGIVPPDQLQVLFVLGRYADQQIAVPEDLDPFLKTMTASAIADADWGVCAFGPHETACLAYTHRQGGKLRVGFENGLWNADGTLAADNADRVVDIRAAIDAQ
ncbi:MAG: 3-keto-5-aminohexanoate cleavage protein [Pseudomonadota bacterium]